MQVDDTAAIFLNNTLVKNTRKLNEVNNELKKKMQEVTALKEKVTTFAQAPKYGAYDEVNEVCMLVGVDESCNKVQGGSLTLCQIISTTGAFGCPTSCRSNSNLPGKV